MDVERTMQFILETQDRTTATLKELAERQLKADLRMDRHERRMDRFDRSLNGIRKLIQTGMKLMVQNQQAIKQNQEAIRELRLSQKATDKRLNAFLASMEKGGNGRGSQ
jgi:hypothetical protein